MRLAPVQLASWGHPETTGLPTIDCFISAQDLEPDNVQANYTEQLITLPHLGCCYQASSAVAVDPDLSAMGLNIKYPILVSPGTPFKYSPAWDRVFVDIARRLGHCQFLFFSDGPTGLSPRLQQRIGLAFSQAQMNPEDYVTFVPWQTRPAFFGLLKRAHVLLDTIGFSGFNTAMHAVECALPIVAMDGRFLRGRLASGILKRMGLHELVAATEEDYVALVTKLVVNADYSDQIREQIKARRHLLYEDVTPIRVLERFLIDVTRAH